MTSKEALKNKHLSAMFDAIVGFEANSGGRTITKIVVEYDEKKHILVERDKQYGYISINEAYK